MKKKLLGIFVCMLLFVTVLSVTGNEPIEKNVVSSSKQASATNNLDVQDSHFVYKIQELPNIPKPLLIWFLQFDFDVLLWSGGLGNAGAEFADNYFYSTRWATTLLHRYTYNPAIPAITNCVEFKVWDPFAGEFVKQLRDLTYDPVSGYFYGGNSYDYTIYEMDFTLGPTSPYTGTVVSKITDPTNTIQVRAIAYDPSGDGGNGWFYVSGWSDPVWIVDRNGVIRGTIFLAPTATSTYGFAYDDLCDSGGPYLWVFDQTSPSGAMVYQWDLLLGTFTGVQHDVAADYGYGIAGGAFFTDGIIPGKATLGGLLQGTPDMMVCYEICDCPSCCLEIVDIRLVSTGPLCNTIEVEFKNTCTYPLSDDVDLTMTFTVDSTRPCPCGGSGYLRPPLTNIGGLIYQKQWLGMTLGAAGTPNSIRTRSVQVNGWAYFDLVVTLTSPSASCTVTETKTGFTGNLLS